MGLKWFKKKEETEKRTEEDLCESAGEGLHPEEAPGARGIPRPTEPFEEAYEMTKGEEGPLFQEFMALPKEEPEIAKQGFVARCSKEKAEKIPPKDVQQCPARNPESETAQGAHQFKEAVEPVDSVDVLKEEEQGFFRRLRNRLSKTRRGFVSRVDQLLLGKKEIDEDLLDELEEILVTSDIGVQTTMALLDSVREKVERKDLSKPEELKEALQSEILSFLKAQPKPDRAVPQGRPHVIMVVGVNGTGKTTTIGKLAARHVKEGKRVLLIAGDTFRAAAVEQLEIWAERVGADVVRHKGKADPSAVVYDGIQAAKSRGVDVVIIDTAGRLHTKVNLMEELKKIRRTVTRQFPGAPHETLLVLDATTGQNAISQAQLFSETLEITGIALAKLDGTAKGGVVVGICNSLGLPLQYIGLGEKMDDLQEFDADVFVKALFQEVG